jgi:hypothetical protein
MLDQLLDLCFDSDILLLFKKLCRYYYFIDPYVYHQRAREQRPQKHWHPLFALSVV